MAFIKHMLPLLIRPRGRSSGGAGWVGCGGYLMRYSFRVDLFGVCLFSFVDGEC